MKVNRILLVDDHPVFTRGLAVLLNERDDCEVVAEAENSQKALALLEETWPNLVIIDLNLGTEDGMDLVKTVHRRFPAVKILVLSMLDESFYAERALQAGAHGYIMKEEVIDQVIDAISTVASGKIWMSEKQINRSIDRLFTPGGTSSGSFRDLFSRLSDRQAQVLTLIGKGYASSEIAERLGIQVKTVETHQYQLKLKLGCTSIRDLRKIAIEWANSQSLRDG